ncbi:MAG: response regulator transcription factor [Acholeplasmataceae bacterium]|jgi:two-component system alkaline phosphatase synthesis response regulator PhoP
MKYLIYSIEDDVDIANIINLTLTKQGYDVETFYDGESFFKRSKEQKPNMILLDMMLPGVSGEDILRRIRSDQTNDVIEIIIISANTMIVDKVGGLDLGADDYIEKPFNILELMSRVNAKVRRYQKNRIIKVADVQIDLDSLSCYKNGKYVELTNREFEILSLLFENKGKVVPRDKILSKIWDIDTFVESRTVDMHIRSLRKKIDPQNKIIKTVYGVGYKVGNE